MSAKSPQFLFVNCTNNPYAETKQSLRDVRRHVMQTHLRKRTLDTSDSALIRKKNRRGSKLSQHLVHEPQHGKKDRPSTPSSRVANSADRPTQPHGFLIHDPTSPSPQSLKSHRFDPFCALPINNIRNIDSILWWHFKVPARQSESALRGVELNFNRRMKNYWALARTNDGFLHSLICLSEIKKAYMTGQPRDEVSYYENRGAALGIINREFKSPNASNNGYLVALLFCLANLIYGDDGLQAAKSHMNRFPSFVAANQDLSHFSDVHFDFLIRTDLRLAAVACSKPLLHFCPRNVHLQMDPAVLVATDHRALSNMNFLPRTHMDPVTVHAVFNHLHQLCILCDRDDLSVDEVKVLENVMYWTEYHLCTMVAEGAQNPTDESESKDKTLNAFHAVVIASQLFAWACMKCTFHMWQADTVPDLLDRLVLALERPNDLVTEWLRQGTDTDDVYAYIHRSPLESFLWVLFTALCALRGVEARKQASRKSLRSLSTLPNKHPYLTHFHQKSSQAIMSQTSTRRFLCTKMAEVVSRMRIRDRFDFERILRHFPSTKHYPVDIYEQTWSEVTDVQGMRDKSVVIS